MEKYNYEVIVDQNEYTMNEVLHSEKGLFKRTDNDEVIWIFYESAYRIDKHGINQINKKNWQQDLDSWKDIRLIKINKFTVVE